MQGVAIVDKNQVGDWVVGATKGLQGEIANKIGQVDWGLTGSRAASGVEEAPFAGGCKESWKVCKEGVQGSLIKQKKKIIIK